MLGEKIIGLFKNVGDAIGFTHRSSSESKRAISYAIQSASNLQNFEPLVVEVKGLLKYRNKTSHPNYHALLGSTASYLTESTKPEHQKVAAEAFKVISDYALDEDFRADARRNMKQIRETFPELKI